MSQGRFRNQRYYIQGEEEEASQLLEKPGRYSLPFLFCVIYLMELVEQVLLSQAPVRSD